VVRVCVRVCVCVWCVSENIYFLPLSTLSLLGYKFPALSAVPSNKCKRQFLTTHTHTHIPWWRVGRMEVMLHTFLASPARSELRISGTRSIKAVLTPELVSLSWGKDTYIFFFLVHFSGTRERFDVGTTAVIWASHFVCRWRNPNDTHYVFSSKFLIKVEVNYVVGSKLNW